MNSNYLLKYIKFDYGYKNYHLIQCWKSKFKVFNIDFEVNKPYNYIKINNLSINNDYNHNNQDEYYYNNFKLLDNTLIHNINKFNINFNFNFNMNKIELNKIIIDEPKLLDNDYKLYNYNLEKILNNDEYKIIKKIILSNLYEYAKYKNINTITMTNINNHRYNAEFKEEGFKIDDLKIILKSL
jgi:hypothetical protein